MGQLTTGCRGGGCSDDRVARLVSTGLVKRSVTPVRSSRECRLEPARECGDIESQPGRVQRALTGNACFRNRVDMELQNGGRPDWRGEGYIDVCQRPWRFSCWNKAIRISRICPAPTGGATRYYATTMPAAPKCVSDAKTAAWGITFI